MKFGVVGMGGDLNLTINLIFDNSFYLIFSINKMYLIKKAPISGASLIITIL